MAKKEKRTTKTCRYCATEIPYAAKVCPNCRKKQKRGIFGKIVIGLIVLAVIGSLFGNNSSGNDTSNTQKVGSTGTTAASSSGKNSAPEKSDYHVGDTLMDGDVKIVFMSSGEYLSDNQFITPADGNKFIFIQLAFENTSSRSDHSISAFSFDGYADGYAVEQRFYGDDQLSATLSAGRSTSGILIFEVPKDAKDIDIEYKPNLFSDKKLHFIFDGDKTCDYQLPLNTNATEGAYSVGDIVESSKLRITYLACEEYQSNNAFLTPRQGYHFVSCLLEFENLGNSDEHISSMASFDCYADGINCDQTFIRDDDLSATLSAGRKCKGSVTFEVPDNATVIEVEYLSNYWTSNRVVFTVK